MNLITDFQQQTQHIENLSLQIARNLTYLHMSDELFSLYQNDQEPGKRKTKPDVKNEIFDLTRQFAVETFSAENFIEKWPRLINKIGEYDPSLSFEAARDVFMDNSETVSLLAGDKKSWQTAYEVLTAQSISRALSVLGLPEEDLEKYLESSEDTEEELERDLLNAMNEYGAQALRNGDFRNGWGAMLTKVADHDVRLCGEAARQILHAGSAAKFSNIEDVKHACAFAEQASNFLCQKGGFRVAADIAVDIIAAVHQAAMPVETQDAAKQYFVNVMQQWSEHIDAMEGEEQKELARRSFDEYYAGIASGQSSKVNLESVTENLFPWRTPKKGFGAPGL